MAFFGKQTGGKPKSKNTITVNDVISDKSGHISTVQSSASLIDCAKVITFMKVGVLVVVNDQGKFVGMVSERSVVHALGQHEESAIGLTVADILSSDVIASTRDTTLEDVLETMRLQGVRHVPVMDGDNVTGIISISDILRHYL